MQHVPAAVPNPDKVVVVHGQGEVHLEALGTNVKSEQKNHLFNSYKTCLIPYLRSESTTSVEASKMSDTS